MPEGDTVRRQCAILHAALAGGTVTASDLRVPQHATADLTGWRVREVAPRGKHLLLRLDPPSRQDTDPPAGHVQDPPLTLHTHLKMDGIWHVDGKALRSSDTVGGPRPAHTVRVDLTVEHEDGRRARAVAYDVKLVRLLPTAAEDELVGHLGPDLLDPGWGPALRERARENLAAEPARPLGLALLDQRNLAGIGNIYRSELCFLERLHPLAPISAVEDLGALVDRSHRLLAVNADRSRRVTTGGMLGRDDQYWVYGRAGAPCRRCRARIVRGQVAEPRLPGTTPRVVFTCPRCQSGGPAEPPPRAARGPR